jgi:hypothetical protein
MKEQQRRAEESRGEPSKERQKAVTEAVPRPDSKEEVMKS